MQAVELLRKHQRHGAFNCLCGERIAADGQESYPTLPEHQASVVEAAHTITTKEQLDALPFLAVIREVFRNSPSGKNYGGVYERRTSGWQCIAGVYKDGPDNGEPRLPVRLLYPT